MSADHSKQRMSGSVFTPQVKVQESQLRFQCKKQEREKKKPIKRDTHSLSTLPPPFLPYLSLRLPCNTGRKKLKRQKERTRPEHLLGPLKSGRWQTLMTKSIRITQVSMANELWYSKQQEGRRENPSSYQMLPPKSVHLPSQRSQSNHYTHWRQRIFSPLYATT